MYQLESALKAVDLCFKAFHGLHANYPPEAEQVWFLLQKVVYQFTTPWDKHYTGVNAVASDLKNL